MSRKFPLFFLVVMLAFDVFAEATTPADSDQQINDFSLAGYGEKGEKTWDLAGKSADIFTEVIKLQEVNGNLYGKEEDVNLTAKQGDFNKVDGKVHLEKDVVITTSTGAKLTTDTLDWDRKAKKVATEDVVNIERDNMVVEGQGAEGEPDLKKVALKKDVTLDIYPENMDKAIAQASGEKTTITCDGPLEIDYDKNIAVFYNNVKVERPDSTIYCDVMDIYFLSSGDKEKLPETAGETPGLMDNKIDKIVCRGNVRVQRGENTSYSQEAVYSAAQKKLILTGRPKLVIYSTEEFDNASFGD